MLNPLISVSINFPFKFFLLCNFPLVILYAIMGLTKRFSLQQITSTMRTPRRLSKKPCEPWPS